MAGIGVPQFAVLDKNGKLIITWTSGSGLISSIPNVIFNDRLNLQFGFPENNILAPVSPSVENRGKIVGSPANGQVDARHSFVGRVQTSEISLVAPGATIGTVINFASPNLINPLSSGFAAAVKFNSGNDWNIQNNTTGITVNITNNYTGPQTDIRLQDTAPGIDARPVVETLSGSGPSTVVQFQWSGHRIGRLKAGRFISEVKLKVNGGARDGTSSGSNASTFQIGFDVKTFPTDILLLTIPDGVFEINQSFASGDGFPSPLNCVASTDIPVTNLRTWPSPVFVNAVPAATGTRIRLNMDSSLQLVATPSNLTFTGNFGGNRVATFAGVSGIFIEYLISGNPISQGELLTAFSPVSAGVVRFFGSTGPTGFNNAFTVGNFTVASNDPGAAPAQVPTVSSATISSNGTQLTIVWTRSASFVSGASNLTVTFSPVGTQSLPLPTSGNGTSAWIYNLSADAIRIGDTVKLNVVSGWARDSITSALVASATNLTVINNSTVPYPKPVFTPANSIVQSDGKSGKLVFDRRIIIGSSFNTAIKILARDKTDLIVRIFSPVVGTALLSTTVITEDSIVFNLTGGGTIFGNNVGGIGSPNDGDEVRVHSNTIAGAIISQLSQSASQPVGNDPIGMPTDISDFINSIPIGNSSTVPEPATDIIPIYTQSEIFDLVNDQFLRIRFNDGVSSIQLQNNFILPTLISSLVGPISLVFFSMQAGIGDNDEIVFRITGNKVIRAADGEILTLTGPSGIVISALTGDPNNSFGPFVDGTNNFINNSTVPLPMDQPLPPKAQQVQVGIDGKKIGIYYDTPINAIAGIVTVESLLTGNKVASFTSTPAQNTLVTLTISDSDTPIFRGERVKVTIPIGLVSGIITGQLNDEEILVADNNSLIAIPRAPVIDSVFLNDPGDLLVVTFDVPVVAGLSNPGGFTDSDKSGKNFVRIASISENVVNVNVDGIDYEDENVFLTLERDFIRESRYKLIPNNRISRLIVNVSNRTVAAPNLPSNADGLTSEAV